MGSAVILNEILLNLARWLDAQTWSTDLHESLYMYAWIESTHVLTLMVFLGMLFVIDLRMLGLAFMNVPASTLAEKLDRPMMIGFAVMVITGFILYIPANTYPIMTVISFGKGAPDTILSGVSI